MAITHISYTKRKKVYIRGNFCCRYCGKKAEIIKNHRGISFKQLITTYCRDDWRPFEIDHKKPRAKGGTNHINNLITSCAKCNNKKGAKSYKVFLLEIKTK